MTQIHPRVRFIGYARVSTEGQDLAYQIDRLTKAGCTKIFHEKRSGKNRSDRPELELLLADLQQGDVMLATATDRVARDPLDLVNILRTVKDAGAGLRLLDEPFIDTTSEMADLIAYLVGWAARWQRRRILENTAQGREAARLRGVKFGRPRKLHLSECKNIAKQRADGATYCKIAMYYGVSQSTIRRCNRHIGRIEIDE
ncbi:recombinase family protein [Agrobacterium deltaense]